MSKNHSFLDSAALENRINERFPHLDTPQKEELSSLIGVAKTEQLQTLEFSLKSLIEGSGIEPTVMQELLGIITTIAPESRALSTWETAEDRSLREQLVVAGGGDYADEYYRFCLNIRHEYMLNKETLGGNGRVALADKLLVKGHSQITKYIKENSSPLLTQIYPVTGMIPLLLESPESADIKRSSRMAANQDFTLSSDEMEGCVRHVLSQMEQAAALPPTEVIEAATSSSYSDPLTGNISHEQYEERVARIRDLQKHGLLATAIAVGDRTETKRLLREEQLDPTKARRNGVSAFVEATDDKVIKSVLKACGSQEQKQALLSMTNHNGKTAIGLAEEQGNTYAFAALLAGYGPEEIRAYSPARKRELLEINTLYELAHAGHGKVINALLTDFPPEEKDALLLRTTPDKGNILHQAVMSGHISPIKVVFKHASKETAAILLEGAYDTDNLTPLHLAAQEHNPKIIHAVVEGCTSEEHKQHLLQLKDAYNRTPLETAEYFNHKRVRNALRAAAEIEAPDIKKKHKQEDREAEEGRPRKKAALPNPAVLGSSSSSSQGTIHPAAPRGPSL